MSKRTWKLALPIVLGLAALAQASPPPASDLDGAPPAAAAAISPFAGSWAGTFTTSLGGFGVITFEITEFGSLTGTVVNLANGVSGVLVGHFNAQGHGAAVLLAGPGVTIPYLVKVTVRPDGNLAGTAQALANLGFNVQFELAPQ